MRRKILLSAVVVCSLTVAALGQGGQTPPAPPQPAKAAAPIDLTGTWVSIITEDWRWRMVTPAKGDYVTLPINADAKKVADTWDPAKDEAAGEQCKSYGAPAIMRVPGRLRISWQDDNTLKVETDAGTQTRLFHFGDWKSPGGEATWQGDSVAAWETPRAQRGAGVDTNIGGVPVAPEAAGGGRAAAPAAAGGRAGRASAPAKFGSLKVTTTHMRPGYLRKNGVPYSGDAVLTEYWDLMKEPNGAQWVVITSLLDDPKYLTMQFVTSPNFRKEPDESKWDPSTCSSRW
jgi:hypothetical protein